MRRDGLVLGQDTVDGRTQRARLDRRRHLTVDVVDREVGRDALAHCPPLDILAHCDDLAGHVGHGH